MSDPRWHRIKELFAAAAALPAGRRDDYLREQGADPEIVREVHSLLAAHPPTTAGGDAAGNAAPTEGPGSRIGPYKLLEHIGEGGYGTVFAAEQEAPIRRRVALKVIKAGMDSQQVVARFEQERQALALMDHPSIARVFDGGTTPSGRPFFVMELVKGEPITDYCDRERLSTAERLRLFTDVGRAVQHAHQKGVIHRDLKPSNVLVTLVDGKAVPKVIDFGVAKATQGRLTDKTLFTEHKQMIGTPLYMSPEQAHLSGVDVDTRSDVYSLGVMLYELLTGTTPFRREELLAAGLLELHRKLRDEEPPTPSTRAATLGKTSGTIAAQRRVEIGRLGSMLRGDLDWIVMKCLEKDRGRRYESASDLIRDVERHLAGEPVQAAPPTLSYRLRKFLRRHRVSVAIASLGLASITAGGATLWMAQDAASARAEGSEATQDRAAATAFHRARLHADLGDWTATLAQLEEAESLGHDGIAVALARVDALEASGQADRAETLLDELHRRPDLGSRHDLVQLLWLDPSRVRPPGAKQAEWRSAFVAFASSPNLSPGWRAYARAVAAPSMPQAIEILDEALSHEPRHRRAAELRLWQVLILRGPQAGQEEATRFRILWPNDDFGKLASAATLRMLGRRVEADALVTSISRLDLLELYEPLVEWRERIVGAIQEQHLLLISRIHGTKDDRFARRLKATQRIAGIFQVSPRVGQLRMHPIYASLGERLSREVPRLVFGLFNPKAKAEALLPVLQATGAPSLRAIKALIECEFGDAIAGVRELQAAADTGGDLWMERQDLLGWQVSGMCVAVLKRRPSSDIGPKREQIDAQLREVLREIVPHVVSQLSSLRLPDAGMLTQLMSALSEGRQDMRWQVLHCAAHLVAHPQSTVEEHLSAAAALIRIERADLAESIVAGILAKDPDNEEAKLYRDEWLPRVRARSGPPPAATTEPPSGR